MLDVATASCLPVEMIVIVAALLLYEVHSGWAQAGAVVDDVAVILHDVGGDVEAAAGVVAAGVVAAVAVAVVAAAAGSVAGVVVEAAVVVDGVVFDGADLEN